MADCLSLYSLDLLLLEVPRGKVGRGLIIFDFYTWGVTQGHIIMRRNYFINSRKAVVFIGFEWFEHCEVNDNGSFGFLR